MFLPIDGLTLWELAHRLSNKRPNMLSFIVIPHDVKDNLRFLINEIYEGKLESSTLSMEKWDPDSDSDPRFYIRYHLDDIFNCIAGKAYKRSLMKFVGIDKKDFEGWCKRTGYPLPDFWFSGHEIEDFNEQQQIGSSATEIKSIKQSNDQITKLKCQDLAQQLWDEHPNMTINAMRDHDKIIAICTTVKNTYADKTRRSWVQEIAPSHIKGKPGRPKKQT